MGLEPSILNLALRRPVAVGRTSDGVGWCGTDRWLVRDDAAKEPPTSLFDTLLRRSFNVELSHVAHGAFPVIARTYYGLLRPYLRADGITVWLDDAVVSTIESMCGREDEFGEEITVRFDLRQATDRYSPIGFHDEGLLVAIAMPVRMINDHLTDGAGRDIEEVR